MLHVSLSLSIHWWLVYKRTSELLNNGVLYLHTLIPAEHAVVPIVVDPTKDQ